MTTTENLKEILKCKYLVNAEYLKDILTEKNIYAEINYDDNSLLVNKSDFENVRKIIQKENIDETETIDQENFIEELEEWNKNNINPGHYLGGQLPYFYKTKSNHLTFAILFFTGFLFQIGVLFFTNISLWNIIFAVFTLVIAMNFMISSFNYRDELKAKKRN